MNQNTESSVASSNAAPPHCQHRSASSRRFCRMPVSDPASGLCFRHAAQLNKDRDAANIAASLIGDTQEFTSAVAINRSLSELYKLLARDEIPPRRAAVMAYTCNLLLRTLPAIDRELHPPNHEDPIVLDISSYVAQRALSQRMQNAAQPTQDAQRTQDAQHAPYATPVGPGATLDILPGAPEDAARMKPQP